MVAALRLIWLQLLDRVKPRHGIGGRPSPRVVDATPTQWMRMKEIIARHCEHEYEYLERRPGETYTGYCERCRKCGEIWQVVQ